MVAQPSLIESERRNNRAHVCVVCGGHKDQPQGRGVRCYGYLSADGAYQHCTRAEYAKGIDRTPGSETYAHRLGGPCRCGVTHVPAFGAIESREERPRSCIATQSHHYQDADGNTVAIHRRDEYDDGSKSLPWLTPEGQPYRGISIASLPLYGSLEHAEPGEPVYFVEGEKCADALIERGVITVTTGGGADQRDFGAALFPLGGRTVFLLPDNDQPGYGYMRRIAEHLGALGATPVTVTLPDLPPHGDVYDWLEVGGTVEGLSALSIAALERHEAGILTLEPARYPGMKLVALADFMAHNYPPLRWIAEGRLMQGGSSLLVAKAKAGKSTLAREIIVAVLTGEDWRVGLEHHRVKRSPVIYCAKEEHPGWLQREFGKLGLRGDEPLYLDLAPDDGALPDTEQSINSLELVIQDTGARLAVIDPMADFMSIADINSYVEMRKALMRLTHIARRTNCHIMVVHHANKGGQGTDAILGSSALAGAVDTMLLLRRVEQQTRERPHERIGDRILWSIQRYGTDMPETVINH